jgi:hypothetical protein
MAKNFTGEGKQSTFGRNLMNYVASKLPYSGFEAIDTAHESNPKFKYFENQGVRRPEVLAKHSISQSNEFNNEGIGLIDAAGKFSDMMYANVQKNKHARINDYRVMAAFAEIADALDEICDEVINKDDNGNIVKIELQRQFEEDLSYDDKEQLLSEFKKYINYFELERKGWSYFRDILVEGEVYFEHIIHSKHADKGVLGIVRIPTELIDPIYNNIQNLLIKGFLYRKPIIDPTKPNKAEDNFDYIPLNENQVVYFDSGIWNETKTVRLPFIENARRAYRQLSLIEDAILIYRLVRAPERLIFNVDVGNMAPPKAEQYLRKLMSQYWSTKTFDANQGDIVNKFNPQSMLDAFWFAKRNGQEGTSVTQLAGGANLGELSDLMYFVKKLYKALKVPVNRLSEESALQDPKSTLREELKFAKFIVRMQQHFATSLKQGFITHLKMTDLWEDLNIKEIDFDLSFNPPSNYYELREAQKLGIKLENYNNISQNDLVSKTYCQKKYLGWDDHAILANRQYLRVDTELKWELAQIENMGPNWREQIAAQAQGLEDAAGGEAGGGMDLGAAGGGAELGGGAPPAFSGGPAEVGAAGEAPAPEGEAPEATPEAAPETPA